jgi:hypothetical protein
MDTQGLALSRHHQLSMVDRMIEKAKEAEGRGQAGKRDYWLFCASRLESMLQQEAPISDAERGERT